MPNKSSTSKSMSDEACQAMIADVLEEAEGLDLLDLALLIMGTVHLEELLDVAEAAQELHFGVTWTESYSGMTQTYERDPNSNVCHCGKLSCTIWPALQKLPQGEPE